MMGKKCKHWGGGGEKGKGGEEKKDGKIRGVR